jgi:ABC-type transport system involved in multi-copper enzyme maturation permease subunit
MIQLTTSIIVYNFKYITYKIPFIISTEEIVLGNEISKLLNLVKIKYNINIKKKNNNLFNIKSNSYNMIFFHNLLTHFLSLFQ